MNQSSTIEPPTIRKSATPHLTMRRDFEFALQNYHMSPEAERVLAETPFVTMLAPTSTGRNTIIRELITTGHYYFVISDTTRPQRFNDGVFEQNGVEYFFRTEAEVLEDIKKGRYIEAEIIHRQQVSGVSIREVEKAHNQGKIAITDVDLAGACNIARLKPDAVSIMLLPPSFDEWLRRIHKRTQVAPLELYRRLATVPKILETTLRNDYFIFVVNDHFEDAVKTVDELARFGIHHRPAERHSRELARQLREQTLGYLRRHAPEFL